MSKKPFSGNWYLYEATGNKFLVFHDLAESYDEQNHQFIQLKEFIVHKLIEYHQDTALIFQEFDESDEFDIYMHILERDFSESNMCGNGIRVLAKHFMEEFGYDAGTNLRVKTRGGQFSVRYVPERDMYEANLGAVHCGFEQSRTYYSTKITDWHQNKAFLNGIFFGVDAEREFQIISINDVGLEPHLVIHVRDKIVFDDLEKLRKLAVRILHRKDLFPIGINVNFIFNDSSGIHLITYERGVNDFTLACGTGVVCSVFGFWRLNGNLRNHFVRTEVHTNGGTLVVKKNHEDFLLKGTAVKVKELFY
jgi:diaminopimelate epimerase